MSSLPGILAEWCFSARLAWHLAIPRVSRKFGLELEVELEGSTAHYTGVPV